LNNEEKAILLFGGGIIAVALFYWWQQNQASTSENTMGQDIATPPATSTGGGEVTTTTTTSTGAGQKDTSASQQTSTVSSGTQTKQSAPSKTSTCSVLTNRTKSITFSSAPVSKPVYQDPYFEATEVVEQVCVDQNSINYGKVVNTLPAFTYPVTPADVARNPSAYPSYIVSYYKAKYPSMFTNLPASTGTVTFSVTTPSLPSPKYPTTGIYSY